ncbi:MAG: DUF4097 family beta strand repeat-containing protein [Oscillospiraceae bacterium]
MNKKRSSLLAFVVIGLTFVVLGVILLLLAFTIGRFDFSKIIAAIEFKTEIITREFDGDVREITLTSTIAKIELIPGDETRLEAENFSPDALEISFADGALKIRDNEIGLSTIFDLQDIGQTLKDTLYNNRKIKLYINDELLEKLTIDSDLGEITMSGLDVGDLTLRCGTGSIAATNISSGKAVISSDTGSLRFVGCSFGNLLLSSDTGSVNYSGLLFGPCNIESGVGVVKLMLDGTSDDYYIVCEQGVGRIAVNGSLLVGSGKKLWGNSAAATRLNVSAGTGSIDITVK